MADFNLAHAEVLAQQGYFANHKMEGEDEGEPLLCSECFHDTGLRLDARKLGIKSADACKNCGLTTGHKLTKHRILKLCYFFFVRGTIEKFEYGATHLIQFNEQHFNKSQIHVSPWLEQDAKLIEQIGEIGLFYYKPRFWMLGQIEPLKDLLDENKREETINSLLTKYPTYIATTDHRFFRLRTNPVHPEKFFEYDSAPDTTAGNNRFDEPGFPTLYGSPDLELCLHECRISAEDNIYVATLAPARELKLLDMSAVLDEDADEFTSVDLAIHFLFLAGKHSYPICRAIAKAAAGLGFDGLIYPSYFSYLRTGIEPFRTVYGLAMRRIKDMREVAASESIPNIILFGRPVAEKNISVECINKVILNRVGYDVSFGPAYHEAPLKTETVEAHMAWRTKEYEDRIIKSMLDSKKGKSDSK